MASEAVWPRSTVALQHRLQHDDAIGTRRRSVSNGASRMRRRRVRAGVLGAVIGWGIAGLDGGFAETVDIPAPRADFVASGIMISSTFGTRPFDLARQGPLVKQVISLPNDRVEMVFDRQDSLVTVLGPGTASVLPTNGANAGLLDPFSRAERLADAPLHIVRHGIDSHLGITCVLFRATGTSAGRPLRATACVTADGIPLMTAIFSHDLTIHTRITTIDFSPPDPAIFDQSGRLSGSGVGNG